jgi:chromosome segregation ATPase
MKRPILTIVATVFITGAIVTSCNTPAQKVENAQDNVAQANKDLDTANKEYLADIDSYRKQTDDKIAANQKSIDEFNERIAKDKKEAKEEYKKKIDALQQKNTDMKKQIDDYKADGKEKWETFKIEFSKGMDDLGKSFKDLTTKDSK